MTDMNNFSEINQNFDTIKTLLNSIRAQGILNTSDVDKLLTGINTKLEKINTEEDIDLIKIFLSELKQNLEERHSMLISKFGAIESLFSNLLKNSAEMPKSTDIKELFDIVATNLSVFSREVVSQKDILTDITLRIDALRSDDSQKKDIIKNIALLRPDLERLNNGFDSIVISLNDNFKTIIKTITTIDKTEYLDKFAGNLNNIEMSSSTILSALQVLDKKTEQVDSVVNSLASKEDLASTNQRLFELNAQNREISATITDISDRQVRLDSLADKIDASVNIIAGLKSMIVETEENHAREVLEQLKTLEHTIDEISSDTKFDEFKNSLEGVLKNISESSTILDKNLQTSSLELQRIISLISGLNIDAGFQNLIAEFAKIETNVKNSIQDVSQKIFTLQDANVTRVLNDLSSEAEKLNSKITNTQSAISMLCDKNFDSVFENIAELKKLVSQLDENSISSNNAIFSSITDRLTIFENGLRESLDKQEKIVEQSAVRLIEEVDNIKNISNVIDYKMDSSVVEIGNVKRSFADLKTSIDDLLALDFINTVKDLRIDLYASKQEIQNSCETLGSTLSEQFTNDLYSKYELLISKLDSTEEELKKCQQASLTDLKVMLEKVSESLIDILSYVSESNANSNEQIDIKIAEISSILKENSLDYVETVRDIVNVIKVQVEDNLKRIEEESAKNYGLVIKSVVDNTEDVKKELKYSYSKLLEIIDSYNEIKEIINLNSSVYTNNFDKVLAEADSVKSEFDSKVAGLKATLLDKISEFKQELTCENTGNLGEVKFLLENNLNKNINEVTALFDELKVELATLDKNIQEKNNNSKDEILNSVSKALSTITTLENNNVEDRKLKFENLLESIDVLKQLVIDGKAESLNDFSTKVDSILNEFSNIKTVLSTIDENVDGDMTRQLSIIESNFESLVSQIAILFDKSDQRISEKIQEEFNLVSSNIHDLLSVRLEEYKAKIEDSFEELNNKSLEQSKFVQEKFMSLNDSFNQLCTEQLDKNQKSLETFAGNIKSAIDENIKLTAVDYVALNNKLSEFAKSIEDDNKNLSNEFLEKTSEIINGINSALEVQSQEINVKYENLHSLNVDYIEESKNNFDALNNTVDRHLSMVKATEEEVASLSKKIEEHQNLVNNSNLETLEKLQLISNKQDLTNEVSKNIEKIASTTEGAIEGLQKDISALSQSIVINKELLNEVDASINERINSLELTLTDNSSKNLETLTSSIEEIGKQLDSQKQLLELTKLQVSELIAKELDTISNNVEKETDVIITELIEQFDLLKKSQKDDIVNLVAQIEEVINSHVYNNIEDLKSYLDIKTDNSIISNKLDLLKTELSDYVSDIINNVSKLLDVSVFTSSINDFKLAIEVLINTSFEGLNNKVDSFIKDNTLSLEKNFNLFDKSFKDIVTDKFEEVKIFSNQYQTSFDMIQKSLSEILADFEQAQISILEKFDLLALQTKEAIQTTNNEIRALSESFNNLRSQISNKSFDEAFQASINKQISSLENLIKEQLNYIEDINELCEVNLPDVTELNTLVKHSILESIKEFSNKLDNINIEDHLNILKSDIVTQFSNKFDNNNIEEQLNILKSDIVTQFLNMFNQISFVAEQEEILDFIQEKHDELISILSHIVTTTSDINSVKSNVVNIDKKIDSIKSEIKHLNEKISSVISSEGDVDYIYSLQDLESDIANLRLVLNEMKENGEGQELAELIKSTNDIYKLVESLPNKNDMESMAEDIVSISSRTNKLILASDESYKTLQDNLQDFKLVINDLDERTRNFAQESGMDRIDSKLNAINSMMISGAKTNQVFNQVFEYLAEWVDNAGVQINSISDKIETLNDIGQIKDMLIDLKAGAEDNTESEELVEALGTVFEKQAKKISTLETKLDRIIVETTINNQNNKLDTTPLEETLNKFLAAMDEKISAQQARIDSLEAKLEDVVQILEDKDTSTLTKKVGGMDRQIAKLNKSIEKLASHVVEK